MYSKHLELLDVITSEYKRKSYEELCKIGEESNTNVSKFYRHYKGKRFWVEIEKDQRLENILRIMVEVDPDGILGNLRGVARYFGITPKGELFEDDGMVF